MSKQVIQRKLDDIIAVTEANHFKHEKRFGLLFKPGKYEVDAHIGFYTSIAGLGALPGEVQIDGYVRVEADWHPGKNALVNFWRSAENFTVTPPDGTNRWAVSQAAPMRRVHVKGNLQLDPREHGFASGGYLANCKVDGQASTGSQQQYMLRNNSVGSWAGAVWNNVFVGVEGAPPTSFPKPPITTVQRAPVIREKPFLYYNAETGYRVAVPGVRKYARGTSWANGMPTGTSISLSEFFIAKPGVTAAEINAALDAGKHLLVTPGVYPIDETIRVTHPNTVVLGFGLATFVPQHGVIGMHVADEEGIKIAGLLFDAGPEKSPVLLEVGEAGAHKDLSHNPISLHDIFARIGGMHVGHATTAVLVNCNDVIVDHFWLWRADHGAGARENATDPTGWDDPKADYGLIVRGKNLTAYGLMVEHFQKHDVLWEADGGRTYMFQCEMAYDAPNQESWMDGETRGYAAYKVADPVNTHEGWGLGVYAIFLNDPTLVAERGFEVPDKPGIRFHSLLTVPLAGRGTILHIINDTGAAARGPDTVPQFLEQYP